MPGWFMPQPTDPFPSRMVTAIRTMEELGRREHSYGFDVMSMSMGAHKLDSLVQTMKKHDLDYIRTLVEHPLLWCVAKNAERITTHMLLNDELPGTFESPVPSIFTQVDPINHRWLVELTFASPAVVSQLPNESPACEHL